MFEISNILITSKIYESYNSLVYRGLKKQDNQPVVVKILKSTHPTPELLSRYKQEFNIIYNLELVGVIKPYSLEKYHNTLAIIFEDFGGKSLKILTEERRLTIEEFLKIAIKICAALGQIHAENIIHKDINPSNIVFNPATEELKIIDFGISSVLSRENPIICNPNILEGTLAYISPEQTGRMNRLVDYRSDFYSLGATFYELLTQQLPFQTLDAIELVYFHIAKQPINPRIINPDIPQEIALLVMKLLAKNADDRYRSAYGIQKDLENILKVYSSKISDDNFIIGKYDINIKLNISQKLYGRDSGIKTLISAFERIIKPDNLQHRTQSHSSQKMQLSKSEMILVSGYSGIGKTSLVREIYQPITKSKGYFLSGKFEQFKRDIPYSSLIQALQSLIRQLLTESNEQIVEWQEKILVALGKQGKIITDVIPELELLIGQQPNVSELEPVESQNRFNILFQKFIGVFTTSKQPLVIFLDDLQWADSASLKLIKQLMANIDSGLLLIGAYRDNEVERWDETINKIGKDTGNSSSVSRTNLSLHPLLIAIDEIKQNGTIVNCIHLTPLDLNNVSQLIIDTFNCTEEKAKQLAKLLLEKTAGNPFFINEFLKSLYTYKLLNFNLQTGEWCWNLVQIQSAKITENVVELMSSKIQQLPEATQQIVKLAACIGNDFDLNTLSMVYQKSLLITDSELWQAVIEGFILPIGNSYKLLTVVETTDNFQVTYQFAHDRVQQAAYSLIPEDSKYLVHWEIGQMLLKNTSPAALEEKIFDIVNQLNIGIESITTSSCLDTVLRQQRDELARLNLIASKKAKASAANQLAFNYLQVAISLLSSDSWEQQYNLTLSLYEESAEVAYLLAQFNQMEEFIGVVIQKAANILDSVKVYEVKILAYIAQSKCIEALNIGWQILGLLGVKLPRKVNQFNVCFLLLRAKLILRRQSIPSLIDLPEMSHPQYKAAMRVLNKLASSAYTVAPTLLLQIVFTQIRLSLKYGNTAESAFAYGCYGFILCGVVGDINSGYQFGQLALNLLERLDTRETKAKTLFIAHGLIKHWLEPAQKTLNSLQETYIIGLETGDLEYGAYASMFYCFQALLSGRELKKLKLEMESYSDILLQLGQERALVIHQSFYDGILNLVDEVNYSDFIDEIDNKQLESINNKNNQDERAAFFNLYFVKLMLCYLFGNYSQAIANAKLAEQYIDASISSPVIPNFYFYDSLARLALVIYNPKLGSNLTINKIYSNQKKLQKWASLAPDNYLHKFYLVEAERLKAINKYTQAIDYYNKAIKLASKNGYLHEEALAHELTAKFYLTHDAEIAAQAHMTNAYHFYRQWGANSKIRELESKYPNLLSLNFENKTINIFDTNTSNSQSNQLLDITTVVRASQAISGEIMLDRLLANLMKIVMENAGAQKGYLITSKNQELFIEVTVNVEPDWQVLQQYIPVTKIQNFPTTLINYVVRTQEIVVINDATSDELFRCDTCINNCEVKSVLCIPIISQGSLISIIYLENNLTSEAFTNERLEILKLLSYQVAISLDNARLYEKLGAYSRNLEQEVQKRTKELQLKNEQLQKSEIEIITALAKEKELAELRARFISMTSHEFHTPLNIINSSAQLLERYNWSREEQLEQLHSIRQGVKQMTQLVDGVLNIARSKADKLQFNPIKINLIDYCKKLIEETQAVAGSSHYIHFIYNTNCTINSDHQSEYLAYVDPVLLKLIISNLLSNAIKYSPQGGKIELSLQPLVDYIIFEVKDYGIGIPLKEQSQLFRQFYRCSNVSSIPGTGLGLAIVKKCADLHNAIVAVESEVGMGTNFKITLPIS